LKPFAEIMRDVPSGLPHPDGSFRIEQASMKKRLAMEAYRLALRRFNKFILDGTVPKELDHNE
jgi:hypothetical protein